ncbi:hypothetical protein [Tardiphaga sp. 839_C3_N1_4]|uniref:hypothetical protein n=1 Tax=Tardiphaga sp. 839_C3_N1_4 TaxID=3240761 RepID=UPI003F284EC5
MNKHQPIPKTEAEPNFFHGTSFAVEEIALGLNVLTVKVRNLREGSRNRSAVTQKLAAEDCSKIAGQIKIMSDLLVRVTLEHINRKPRV